MSGHSKWSTIKHKKAITDSRKAKAFTKLSAQISIVAKDGGDPAMNPNLRLYIDKARAAGMAKESIERAIKRGTGELGGAALKEVRYGAIGPGGIAIVIEAVTDNKNRTVNEVRSMITKFGGKVTEFGSVGYLFKEQGIISAKGGVEVLSLAAIDAGALDVEESDGRVLVYTLPTQLESVKKSLETNGGVIESAEVYYEPKVAVTTDDPKATQLLEALDELDDVTGVYTNLA
ncbi:YebC/PmpR family DNA-binding transcriptional regulator [Candidatus Berkelbacteria bacterium]|nr:YebC/PmpR family DNA-binding transcriptional regulator [Candidatus Berkelbacteria bacterium]